MYEKTKDLIKQLAAELEFVTIPALYRESTYTFDAEADRKRNEYETAKDLQNELKALYSILRNY